VIDTNSNRKCDGMGLLEKGFQPVEGQIEGVEG